MEVANMQQIYNVTNGGDSGAGTLREAIELANSNPGEDTIFVGVDVELDSSISITDSVDIGNNYGAKITQTGSDRIFTIDDRNDLENIQVSLYRLTLSGGDSDSIGGAILSAEDLTITDSELSNNSAQNKGGAIFQINGLVNIARSKIDNNQAGDESSSQKSIGGAVYIANSTYDISGSVFDDNQADTADAIFSSNSSGSVSNTALNNDSIVTRGFPAFQSALSHEEDNFLDNGRGDEFEQFNDSIPLGSNSSALMLFLESATDIITGDGEESRKDLLLDLVENSSF
ncbi:MAG: hypothetical protein AAFO95_15705 [Cyanobacteria bacterium J06600_6]